MTREILDDLDQAIRLTMDAVEAIGRDFTKPDDDWTAIVNLLGDDSAHTVLLDFQDDDSKDAMVAVVSDIARKAHSKYAVFVSSAWMVSAHRREEIDAIHRLGGVSKSERREEVVILVGMSKATARTYLAPIERDGVHPPKLGSWGTQATGTEGRFTRIRTALS